jgi:hypothetical protein
MNRKSISYKELDFVSLFQKYHQFFSLEEEKNEEVKSMFIQLDKQKNTDLIIELFNYYDKYVFQIIGKVSFLKILQDINFIGKDLINLECLKKFRGCNIITLVCSELEDDTKYTNSNIIKFKRDYLQLIDPNSKIAHIMLYKERDTSIRYLGVLHEKQILNMFQIFESVDEMDEIDLEYTRNKYTRKTHKKDVTNTNNNNNNNNNNSNSVNAPPISNMDMQYIKNEVLNKIDFWYIGIPNINEIETDICITLIKHRIELLCKLRKESINKKELVENVYDKYQFEKVNNDDSRNKRNYISYIESIVSLAIMNCKSKTDYHYSSEAIINMTIMYDNLAYWLVLTFIFHFNITNINKNNIIVDHECIKENLRNKETSLFSLKIKRECSKISTKQYQDNYYNDNKAMVIEKYLKYRLQAECCLDDISYRQYVSYIEKRKNYSDADLTKYHSMIHSIYEGQFTPTIFIPIPFEKQLDSLKTRSCILIKGNCYVDMIDYCCNYVFNSIINERIYDCNSLLIGLSNVFISSPKFDQILIELQQIYKYLNFKFNKIKVTNTSDIPIKNALHENFNIGDIPDIEDCFKEKIMPPCMMVLNDKLINSEKSQLYREQNQCDSLKYPERMQYTDILLDYYSQEQVKSYLLNSVSKDSYNKHYRSSHERAKNHLTKTNRMTYSYSCNFYQYSYNIKNSNLKVKCGCPFESLNNQELTAFLKKQHISQPSIDSILEYKKKGHYNSGCMQFYYASEHKYVPKEQNVQVRFTSPFEYIKSKLMHK